MRWEPKPSILLIATLALVLLANSAHAAPVTPWFSDIYLWVGLSIAISASFLGLAYMAGKLFQLNMLDAWVKIEIQELGAAMIIAVFCIAMVATADSAAAFLTGQPSHIGDFAKGSIQKVYNDGRDFYRALGDVYFDIAKVASYSYSAGITPGYVSYSISASPGAGLYPLVTEIGGAMDSVANLMLFLIAQQALIIFFVNASVVMLPVGIFLRCFSLTRKVGGVVLAAVIGASVIYPASFAISDAIYKPYSPHLAASTHNLNVIAGSLDPGNPPLTGVVCNPAMQYFIQSPLGFAGALIGMVFQNGGGVGGAIGMITSEIGAGLLSGETGWQIIVCPLVCATPCAATVGTGCAQCLAKCYIDVQNTFVDIKSFYPIAMYPLLTSYVGGGVGLLPLGNYWGGNTIVPKYFEPVRQFALPEAAIFGVLTIVYSIIPIIISMTLLRNLAVTFGGEPQLYGISKLV
ncbi:MAG: hypothetical protein NTV88_05250 [Candidatus Micrarchaeota archaeon]|nr:hypothetical protein [Candidatus Micrarchaeota archaeon]